VEHGERLAFIGPNGAGKSTSIKMLTGILRPSGGTVRVLGLEPWTRRRDLSRRVGTLFGQRSQLWSELPARTSLLTLGAIFGLSSAEVTARVAELGELLDATDLLDQPVRTLSLGQRMRCELAACLLHEPQLLFLDEPTIGLDLLAKQRFREVLVRLNAELGTTVFLTSHDVADIEHVAERAIIVNHGTVIHDSPVAELRRGLLATKRIDVRLGSAADGDQLRGWLAAEPSLATTTIESGIAVDVDTNHQPIDDVLNRILAGVAARHLSVVDLSVTDPPLEQVIGTIYARPAGPLGSSS
jgi:ABC-2 type transport system ATP-binding protein